MADFGDAQPFSKLPRDVTVGDVIELLRGRMTTLECKFFEDLGFSLAVLEKPKSSWFPKLSTFYFEHGRHGSSCGYICETYRGSSQYPYIPHGSYYACSHWSSCCRIARGLGNLVSERDLRPEWIGHSWSSMRTALRQSGKGMHVEIWIYERSPRRGFRLNVAGYEGGMEALLEFIDSLPSE